MIYEYLFYGIVIFYWIFIIIYGTHLIRLLIKEWRDRHNHDE